MTSEKRVSPSWGEKLQHMALGPRDLLLYLISREYSSFKWLFRILPPWYIEWTSKTRANRAFYNAVNKVPAYKKFISKGGFEKENIPETDKANYIRAFQTEERCINGNIPEKNTTIDESSGSTGTPYNWVRSSRERKEFKEFISYFSRYCFGDEPYITINAFSMGAWATGINMGEALQSNSIVKNTGPDIGKILNTLSFFGSEHKYLILGYPPFIKQLIDAANERNFPIKKYKLNAMVGGEGMAEGLRDYLLPYFENVYSGYGATDLEIGIAGETPISVMIRRLARDNPKLRKRLFGEDSRLPMLFQYNPLMHYVEVNKNRELIFTITRLSLLSPRIRYNVHDEGGIARYDELAKVLKEEGYDMKKLEKETGNVNINFPFLWVFGRRDFTISVMGANIYPEDLEQCIYSDKKLAKITKSFCQSLLEGAGGKVKPCFFFEINTKPTQQLKRYFAQSILAQLIKMNADFREAYHESPGLMTPEVKLYRLGEGPFSKNSEKIKQVRLVKEDKK